MIIKCKKFKGCSLAYFIKKKSYKYILKCFVLKIQNAKVEKRNMKVSKI